MVRVLIISDSPTLSDALKSLLLSESQHIEVIGQETDVSYVIHHLETLNPDVIIWADTGLRRNAIWEEICLHAATLDFKIISLNLRNNEITIYQSGRKRILVVHGVEDLIESIQGDFLPKQPEYQAESIYSPGKGRAGVPIKS